MRVTVNSVDEFLECLESVTDIFDSTIRVSSTRRALSASKDCVSWEVFLQLAAVVKTEDAEYLLDMGCSCGRDVEDETQDFKGTAKVRVDKGRIADFATQRGWRILPGVISE